MRTFSHQFNSVIAFILIAQSRFKKFITFQPLSDFCICVRGVECWQPEWSSQLSEWGGASFTLCHSHSVYSRRKQLVGHMVLWRQPDKNFWLGGLLNDRNTDQLLNWVPFKGEEEISGGRKTHPLFLTAPLATFFTTHTYISQSAHKFLTVS